MRVHVVSVLAVFVAPVLLGIAGREGSPGKQDDTSAVSYTSHVAPIIKKYCLPCHAEESSNSSELSLDTYALLMKGGEHGRAVVPGKPGESVLLKKLEEEPPFGDRMPLLSRRRKNAGAPKELKPEELRVLKEWIAQGAKNN